MRDVRFASYITHHVLRITLYVLCFTFYGSTTTVPTMPLWPSGVPWSWQ
jgi:hypothetical protein